MLALLCKFPGETEPFSSAYAESLLGELADWTAENSWDARAGADSAITSLSITVVGWLALPDTNRFIDQNTALTEAQKDPNIDVTTYDRFIFLFAGPSPAGQCTQFGPPLQFFQSVASVGSPGYFAPMSRPMASLHCAAGGTLGDICHEFAHTYGLVHATSRSSITTRIHAYGNSHDLMGDHTLKWFPHNGQETAPHLQAAYKEQLGWMEPPDTVSTSGLYYVVPLERAMGDVGDKHHALKIPGRYHDIWPTSGSRFLYVEFRRPWGFDDVGAVDSAHVFNQHAGALLNDALVWAPVSAPSRFYSTAIDCTPETPMDQIFDGALPVGRSFTDRNAGVCISAVSSEDDTLAVRVNFLSEFPTNRAPSVKSVYTSIDSSGVGYDVTFVATATDPDLGDPLLYFWNFEVDWYDSRYIIDTSKTPYDTTHVLSEQLYKPGTFGSGAQVTHNFVTDSPRRVYLEVSDQRGGESDWYEVSGWGGGSRHGIRGSRTRRFANNRCRSIKRRTG